MINNTIKYVAELAHVREVTLLGTADLAYWRARLEEAGLSPIDRNGRAEVLIVAADSRYKGIRFRELSFSIFAAPPGKLSHESVYLVSAFNTCRTLAFGERVLFKTPYRHGNVRVGASFTPSIQLLKGEEAIFQADMGRGASAAPREPATDAEDGWAGAIFLPRKHGRCPGNLFFARLRGRTQTYPFVDSQDVLTLRPGKGVAIVDALIDSNLAGHEWIVRHDAMHAKSKTYSRSNSPV